LAQAILAQDFLDRLQVNARLNIDHNPFLGTT